MAKICPATNEKVLYLDCLDCDDKVCKRPASSSPSLSESDLRLALFVQYQQALQELYSPNVKRLSADEMRAWAQSDYLDKTTLSGKSTDWVDVRNDCGRIIGFLIIQKGQFCHPDVDCFIAQAFVSLEERRKGYLRKTLGRYIHTNNINAFCLLEIITNHEAISFWKHITSQLGFSQIELLDVGAAGPEELQLGFRKIDRKE